MFITKKHLRRRTFLRGMGATVALPLLDAMIPALAATAARPAPRAAFVYFPHGAVMSEWTPSSEGRIGRLGRILEPLGPFEDRLTVVSGLENRHANGPVHALTPGTWLSGVSPRSSAGASAGVTADQIAAAYIGKDTPLASIQLATESTGRIAAGAWEGEFAASYGTTISFHTASEPLAMEASPRRLFEKLFAPQGQRGARSNVLDGVADDARALRRRLGPADRAVLRDYLDRVRDVERRAAKAEARLQSSPDSRAADAEAFAERLRLLFDLIVVAFQADMTRVASFMMAAEASDRSYEHLGISESFHALSHHQNDPAKLEKLVRIQSYHTGELARFVRKLAELRDGDGSLLDRALILYGSNMSDSYLHDHGPLPLALVGGACGKLRGGQHLRYPDRTPISNLLVTMLDRVGAPIGVLGDSRGECAEI